MEKVLIVIPTYNESKNIAKMLDALELQRDAIEAVGYDMNVLIADDTSPDGTADIVREKQKTMRGLQLKMGEKAGLGAAYSRVFNFALASNVYSVIITMDADFSHDPVTIKDMLTEINNGASFVVGSRYIKGGSIPGDWPFIRIVNTRVANLVARYMGGIGKDGIRDITAGFRAMRTEALKTIRFEAHNASGYSFQINLTNEFIRSGLPISEIPINFIDRTAGESKIRFKDITNFIAVAWHLNSDSPIKQGMRYALVGGSGVIVNLGSLWLLRENGFNSVIAAMLALELSILNNFIGHSTFTFRSARTFSGYQLKSWYQRFAAFHGLTAFSALVILAVSLTLNALGMHYIIAQANGIIAAMALNYLFSSRLIWSPFIRNA